jgi:ribose transport system ATP-binding protein
MSIRENLFLPRLRGGRIAESVLRRPRAERRAAHALAERFEVRPSHDMDRSLTSLSGGNQQKVVCGRALRSHPRLLVVDDPTAGVDVGSRAQLHDILRDSAAAGTSIVIASTDYDEVAGLADRALVMVNGSVYAELARGDLAADRLAQASYGRGVAATDTTTA